jgi:hypothetical protein
MKLAIFALLISSSLTYASESTFSCKGHRARTATLLTVSPSKAVLGSSLLVRDIHYRAGNNNKRYYRYSNEQMDLLVPTVMAKNQVNQGVVVAFKSNTRTRLSCIK